TDIGVDEPSTTPIGFSLQRAGDLGTGVGLTWQAAQAETPNALNANQTVDGATCDEATAPLINEFSFSTTGLDVEYIEIIGDADTDYSAYTFIVIEGEGTSIGVIDDVIAIGTTDANGLYTELVAANAFENGTQTALLVSGFTGSATTDLDTDDDGTFDSTPWDAIVDSVAINDGSSSDITYGTVVLSGNYDGVSNLTPGGASRIPDGFDTDSASDWVRNDFDLAGIDGFEGTPVFGEAFNTPNAFNAIVPDPNAAIVFINEIHYDNISTDVNESIEIMGTANADLSNYSIVLYNGSNNETYGNTINLSGTLTDQCNGYGFSTIVLPANGLQNGSPDGLALVENSTNTVIEFLSYEGTMTAANGPAVGLTSTDIGVTESNSTTPIGFSLQLGGDVVTGVGLAWQAPQDETPNAINTNQTVDGIACIVEPPTPDIVKIHDIQGAGDFNLLDGQTVRVEAVVVGDFQDIDGDNSRNLRGFYLQEENIDHDGDSATSEGIFVFANNFAVDVNVGDVVQVTGAIDEFFGETQIENITNVVVVGTAVEGVDYSAAVITLPLPTRTNFDGELIADLEPYEGMLVTFPQDLTITELFQLGRFGELSVSQGGRLFQYTNDNTPSVTGYAAHLQDIASRSIVIDDGLTFQNPNPVLVPGNIDLTTDAFRMGDTLTNVTGVVRFSRGSGGSGDEVYRIMLPSATYTAVNTRTAAPEVGGDLRVASFNVLNFFTTLDDGSNDICGPLNNVECRGADTQAEFDRQLDKTVTALLELDADIVGLVELENNSAANPAGDGFDPVLEVLVNALNANANATRTYGYVDAGVVGSDAIKVAFIYDVNTVGIADGTSIATLDDTTSANLGFATPLFEGSNTNRQPLAVTFEDLNSFGTITIVNNHFKSKGGSGSGLDADQNDGAGSWNDRRTQAALAITAWLATDPTHSSDDDVLIIGDFNSYLQEDPIVALEANFDNLLDVYVPNAYSFIFDGQAGALDGGFSSTSLTAQITGVAEWHINADEANVIDYNLDFGADFRLQVFDAGIPERASDHDPLLIGMTLASDNAAPVIASIGDQNVDEASTFGLEITITDEDSTADALTVTSTVGTITQSTDTTWFLSIPTSDGPVDSTSVTINVSDDKDGTSTATFALTVNNVAPTADLISYPDRPIFQGTDVLVRFINSTDVSPEDLAAGFNYALFCGDSSPAFTSVDANEIYSCTYNTVGSFTIVGMISDKDGGISEDSIDVEVISSADAADYIAGIVEGLGLNRGQTNALTVKLANVRTKLEAGQINVAINNLNAFTNQVNAFISGGVLSNADGQLLLGLAQDLLDSINSN
ncbi:MAG: ExeM/NucH family extracellular endonuclease, partial [Phototrophicaceae bacterium]